MNEDDFIYDIDIYEKPVHKCKLCGTTEKLCLPILPGVFGVLAAMFWGPICVNCFDKRKKKMEGSEDGPQSASNTVPPQG